MLQLATPRARGGAAACMPVLSVRVRVFEGGNSGSCDTRGEVKGPRPRGAPVAEKGRPPHPRLKRENDSLIR